MKSSEAGGGGGEMCVAAARAQAPNAKSSYRLRANDSMSTKTDIAETVSSSGMDMRLEWAEDWPIGAWGALKIGRRIYVGWRSSQNFWFRPFLKRGERWHRFRDGGLTVPLRAGDKFKAAHHSLKSHIMVLSNLESSK